MMKRIIYILVLILDIFLLSSCDNERYSEGFEHMYDDRASFFIFMGKTEFYKTFKKYNYIDGNYFYYDSYENTEKFLMYFKYEEEDYLKAKEYLFENFSLWDEPIREYNNYVFYLNKDFVNFHNFSETNDVFDYWYYGFPNIFNAYCYNDRTFTLILMGYNLNGIGQERDLAKDEFGKFLESAFGKYYDFNQ